MHGIINMVTACVKVLYFSPDTGPKSFLPVVYHLGDNSLFKVSPNLHQSLLHLS